MVHVLKVKVPIFHLLTLAWFLWSCEGHSHHCDDISVVLTITKWVGCQRKLTRKLTLRLYSTPYNFGGVACTNGSMISITNSNFTENWAAGHAIFLHIENSTLLIQRSVCLLMVRGVIFTLLYVFSTFSGWATYNQNGGVTYIRSVGEEWKQVARSLLEGVGSASAMQLEEEGCWRSIA